MTLFLRQAILALTCSAALFACSPTPTFLNQNVSGSGYHTAAALNTTTGSPLQLNAATPNQVTALFFGFTQCPDVCPTTMGTIKLVRQALAKQNIDSNRLRVIFMTLDPERDTAAILKDYTAAFNIPNAPANIGAYTDLATTATIAKDFNIEYKKVGTGTNYTLNHSANLYLIDPTGKTRVSVPYGTPADSITHDVVQLLNTAK